MVKELIRASQINLDKNGNVSFAASAMISVVLEQTAQPISTVLHPHK